MRKCLLFIANVDFEYSIKRWKTKVFHRRCPLLYLAFHAEKERVLIGVQTLSLDELAVMLGDKCGGVVVYFGICKTLNIDKRRILSFMEKAERLLCLDNKVDGLLSALFDIRLLSYLLQYPRFGG